MSCVVGRGHFEEVGSFGSRLYKNNELSDILRSDHPLSLKSAVTFMYNQVSALPFEPNANFSFTIVEMKASKPPLVSLMLRKCPKQPKSHRNIYQNFLP